MLAVCAAALCAYHLPLRPLQVGSRATAARLGFEIESLDQKAVEEMEIFGWPGLEKKLEDFTMSAAAQEIKMVYVKEGSATLTDAEETAKIEAGQMVMVSDGDVRWTGVEPLTLLSQTVEVKDVEEFSTDDLRLNAPPTIKPEDEPVKDLTLKEAGLLLVGGLLAGKLASFGFAELTAPLPGPGGM